MHTVNYMNTYILHPIFSYPMSSRLPDKCQANIPLILYFVLRILYFSIFGITGPQLPRPSQLAIPQLINIPCPQISSAIFLIPDFLECH